MESLQVEMRLGAAEIASFETEETYQALCFCKRPKKMNGQTMVIEPKTTVVRSKNEQRMWQV